jgi:hypothetical protein
VNIRDLEEVNFFYRLHAQEFEIVMKAAQEMRTQDYKEARKRMKVISLRFRRAQIGYYQRLKA